MAFVTGHLLAMATSDLCTQTNCCLLGWMLFHLTLVSGSDTSKQSVLTLSIYKCELTNLFKAV